jgi:hypothetical protein
MIIRNILSQEDKEFICNKWNSSRIKKSDHQAKNTSTIRQASFLKDVHRKVKKILQEKTNLKLKEKFTLIREYKKGDLLKKHVDNASPFAITIIVKQSDNKKNPLIFYNKTSTDTIILQEGDGYYFKGNEIPHERTEVQSDKILHIYLGYRYINKLI